MTEERTAAELKTEASCCDDYDPQSLTSDEALDRIFSVANPIDGFEKIALRSALGRVLKEDIKSGIDVPLHTNSAMDGYAVRGDDLPSTGTATFQLKGTAFAGNAWHGTVGRLECIRIMTGAIIPAGADTVVMQEHVEIDDAAIRIDDRHRSGQNVRAAGEDISAGDIVLRKGKLLAPSDLGLIASLGIGEVLVRRKLRVAYFSTGDELRSIGEPLKPGDVYDSNRYTLYGMLTRLGVETIDMGVIRDEREAVSEAFRKASACADVVVTSGGVSVGEADYIKEVLESVGNIDFWKVAMKPGRPLAFGRIGDAVFFGLPGNPVSVMVTFYQFVQPALRHMLGEAETGYLTIRATSLSRLKKRPGRTEYQRGILETNEKGQTVVRRAGEQGSGILTSMSAANCFIVLPMESGPVEEGTEVEVQPFPGIV